ncbi:adhesion G protein-coupled receptor L3-like isoform X2 [Dreissena polymorpha]|uniref:adhesion G protein-coupled receptor L3-like isoform X2 n=1 Tax=Dreissena polymorpha TaxID=45954 RepID=UPI00226560FD|nr:adhesion G protein-coupled receptor L3-like isoform X2 [Dreissena polymorpha]
MLKIVFVIFLLLNAEGLAQSNVTQSSLAPAGNTTTAPRTRYKACPEIHKNISSDIGSPGYRVVEIDVSTCSFWSYLPVLILTDQLKEYVMHVSVQPSSISLDFNHTYFTSNVSDVISGNVIANYSDGTTLMIPIKLTIVDINDPPVFTSRDSLNSTLSEASPVGYEIFTVTVADPDSKVELSTTSDLVAIHQEVSNATDGTGLYLFTLRINKPLDVDTPNEAFIAAQMFRAQLDSTVTAVIPLIATDGYQQTRQNLQITIRDENDNPPVCNPAQTIVYVPRNRPTNISVLSLNSFCTDKDRFPLHKISDYSFNENRSSCSGNWTVVSPHHENAYPEACIPSQTIIYVSRNQPTNTAVLFLNSVCTDKECPADTDAMGTHWFSGRIGFIEGMSCPSNTYGNVTRYCDMDGLYRDPVYNCTRTSILDVYTKFMYTAWKATDILSRLAKVINDSNEQLMVGDVEKIRFILQNVGSDLGQSDIEPEKYTDFFLDVVNTLIGEKAESTWKVLVNQTRIGADSIVSCVDKFVNNMVTQSNGTNYNHTFIKSNFIAAISETLNCSIVKFPGDSLVGYSMNSDHDFKEFPSWASGRSNNIRAPCMNSQVYSGIFYRNLSSIVSLNSAIDRKWPKNVNAPVISFAYLSSKSSVTPVKKPDTPVEISFEIYDQSLSDPVCAYLQFNESGGPNIWSTEGCSLTSFDRNTGVVTCTCSHLTNFAVLMSPAVPTTAHAHSRALGLFSIIGCSISMVGLSLTVIVHLVFWRSLSSDRTVLLMNVCFIFFIGYLVFLTGIEKTSNSTVCTAIAVILHYIFLVVFFLMLAEGLMITYLVLSPFRKRRIVVPFIIAAYAIPILIVGISMGVTQLKGYGNESFCWLTVDGGLYWAFAGPIILVVVGNIVNLGIILKFGVFGISAMAKKSDLEKIKTGARSVGVLTPMFGITWLIGVFAVNDATLVFQWLFVILNSLQGLMIFIVKCPLDKKVQDAFKEKRRRFFSVESSASGEHAKHKTADGSKQTESSM